MKEELFIGTDKNVWERHLDCNVLHNISQYETIDIDYSHCHPVVEYFLRRGKMVKCARVGFLKYPHEYEPIKRKVLGKKELIQRLLDDGYLPNTLGDWCKRRAPFFMADMFLYCGEEQGSRFVWRDCWLEEN